MINPGGELDKVVARQESGWVCFFVRVLPLVIFLGAIQAWLLTKWGKYQTSIQSVKVFTVSEAVAFWLLYLVTHVLVILVASWMVRSVTLAFGMRRGYDRALLTISYAFLPAILFGLFSAIPKLPVWLPSLVGIYFCWRVLYRAVPRILQPEHAYALGQFISVAVITTLGVSAICVLLYLALQGKFAWWSDLVGFVSQTLKLQG